ncbi:MAG TPA: GNAT family N-acetyltransferase [Blastocatellia bacterium]|nr:GNAT family N-acetyltransferase [Blastocatellia bacterium]
MSSSILQHGMAPVLQPLSLVERPLTLSPLVAGDKAETLRFLSARPLHTIFMAGFIHDNGLESPTNRGTFYGARNEQGRLEGVALIGSATLIEASSEAALAAFARLAQQAPHANLILGEQEKVERFWAYYSENGQTPRRMFRQLLLEQRRPVEMRDGVSELRLATLDDLPELLPVYGEMVFEESGVNPMESEPEGFRERWARRVEMGRVWVWMKGRKLVFNADVICDTTDVIYLEGIYVHPQERGRGYGLRCLSQLSSNLLKRTESLCLLVNEQNHGAQALYRAAGFKMRAYYDTIYLHQKN